MKIRIKIPDQLTSTIDSRNSFIDDILIWGMETGIDVEFYNYFYDVTPLLDYSLKKNVWAILKVEEKDVFMFILKWGAMMHKEKLKGVSNGNI